MRARPAPKVRQARDAWKKFSHDAQFKAWAKRIQADPNAPIGTGVPEAQLRFLVDKIAQRRGIKVNQTHFDKALEETTPVLSVPQVDDLVGDLDLLFQMPEMEDLWCAWGVQRRAAGPAPRTSAVKALMTTMAVPGITNHASKAHELILEMPGLRAIFERLERTRLARQGTTVAGDAFDPLTYEGALRSRKKVAEPVPQLAMRTNIGCLKELRQMFGPRVGQGFLIDGSSIPAWAPQRGSRGDEDLEAELRRHAPDAGFRAMTYAGGGKAPAFSANNAELYGGKIKCWRGYYLVCLVEQATGLPAVWTLIDSQEQETTALVPLLSLLFNLWPELDGKVEWLAGDSAFDTKEICRTCEVNYGIHPIFRLHGSKGGKLIPQGTVRGDKLRSMSHEGEYFCASHQEPLEYETLDRPARTNLRPGQASAENLFRYRLKAGKQHGGPAGVGPCGRFSLPAGWDWRRNTYFPHHGNGRPELFAMREALLIARLNQNESIFSALKGSKGLGGTGANRTRIREIETHEGLISLAFVGRTALTLLDQRLQRGWTPPASPNDASPAANGGPAAPALVVTSSVGATAAAEPGSAAAALQAPDAPIADGPAALRDADHGVIDRRPVAASSAASGLLYGARRRVLPRAARSRPRQKV